MKTYQQHLDTIAPDAAGSTTLYSQHSHSRSSKRSSRPPQSTQPSIRESAGHQDPAVLHSSHSRRSSKQPKQQQPDQEDDSGKANNAQADVMERLRVNMPCCFQMFQQSSWLSTNKANEALMMDQLNLLRSARIRDEWEHRKPRKQTQLTEYSERCLSMKLKPFVSSALGPHG